MRRGFTRDSYDRMMRMDGDFAGARETDNDAAVPRYPALKCDRDIYLAAEAKEMLDEDAREPRIPVILAKHHTEDSFEKYRLNSPYTKGGAVEIVDLHHSGENIHIVAVDMIERKLLYYNQRNISVWVERNGSREQSGCQITTGAGGDVYIIGYNGINPALWRKAQAAGRFERIELSYLEEAALCDIHVAKNRVFIAGYDGDSENCRPFILQDGEKRLCGLTIGNTTFSRGMAVFTCLQLITGSRSDYGSTTGTTFFRKRSTTCRRISGK